MKPRLHRLKAFPLVSSYTPGWCKQGLNLATEGQCAQCSGEMKFRIFMFIYTMNMVKFLC